MPDQGKPSEKTGRKATGLRPSLRLDMAAGLPGSQRLLSAGLPSTRISEVLTMKIVLSRSDLPLLVRSQRGMSMIELIVTIGILSLLMAFSLPNINSGVLNLPLVSQTLVGDIRMARANATTRGVHYRVSIESSSYTIQRLQDEDEDDVWEPDGAFPTQTVELPTGLSITFSSGEGAIVEFTTRGLLVEQEDGTPAEIVTLTVVDSIHDESKSLEVWPSGQVQEV